MRTFKKDVNDIFKLKKQSQFMSILRFSLNPLLSYAASFITMIFIATVVYSRPEFAAREGKTCDFCHIDPAGGGPRNPVGQVFEKNGYKFPKDFDVETFRREAEQKKIPITTSVHIRSAYIKPIKVSSGDRAVPTCNSCHASKDTFFLMQGELAVSSEPNDKLKIMATSNMGTPLDVFAVVSAIPEHLYVKIGQFQIPFGLKGTDHNILVRQGYRIGSNLRDVGIEVGGVYSSIFYNIAVFNGNRIALTAIDNNQHKGFATTAGCQYKFLRAGLSYLIDRPAEARQMLAAGYLTASVPPISIEGEFDIGGYFKPSESLPLSEDDITSKGYFVGVGYKVNPFLHLSAQYGLFDPDRQIKGDALSRLALRSEYSFMPNSSLDLIYWLNIENKDRLEDEQVSDKNLLRQLKGDDQIILMWHFWF
ncbi:hypothetical protein FJZ31_40645 [Candidatus Poribacteria bacterium]|nr:hypothetical protein [Candidatus Poribacteria bacterium]